MSRIDLGGGLAPAPGHINIDIINAADVIWDLNRGLRTGEIHVGGEKTLSYLYTDIEGIRCHMLLEHLDTIIPLMNDCYAVLQEGAQMEISVPYAGTKEDYQDPTHKRHFVEESFLYFAKNSPYEKEQNQYGITARFTIIKCEKNDWMLEAVLQK